MNYYNPKVPRSTGISVDELADLSSDIWGYLSPQPRVKKMMLPKLGTSLEAELGAELSKKYASKRRKRRSRRLAR